MHSFLWMHRKAQELCPIRFEKDCLDLLAFTGHKALLGPTGTGGLIVGEKVDALLARGRNRRRFFVARAAVRTSPPA